MRMAWIGVYSFARYDPAFYRQPRGSDYAQVLHARLHRFYRDAGWDDEAAWTKHRLEGIVGKEEAKKLMEAAQKGVKS